MTDTKGRPARPEAEKVLLKMIRKGGWVTPSNVKFTEDEPFQLVPEGEANVLLKEGPNMFTTATPEELKTYYGL